MVACSNPFDRQHRHSSFGLYCNSHRPSMPAVDKTGNKLKRRTCQGTLEEAGLEFHRGDWLIHLRGRMVRNLLAPMVGWRHRATAWRTNTGVVVAHSHRPCSRIDGDLSAARCHLRHQQAFFVRTSRVRGKAIGGFQREGGRGGRVEGGREGEERGLKVGEEGGFEKGC